jgi:peptidyl-prolyl cis-trans isomerase C
VRLIIAALIALLVIPTFASAQAPDDASPAAFVNGRPITLLQVKRVLVSAFQGKSIPAEMLPLVQAQSLEQAILRRVMFDRLKELKYEPTADELRETQETFDANLALAGITAEEYRKRSQLSEQDLDDLRYWDIAWRRYVGEHLTDDDLKAYFDEHRRDFDGTELRVSHILWRIEGRREQADIAGIVSRAQQLRDEILAGKITFAAAAAKHSAGPSRENGGDLGFIARREPMGEEFSAAAFKLKTGEISPPVLSPFGIHLITVTDEKPGTKTWADVREQLKPAAENDLFRRTAGELRKSAKVEYTNLLPHLDPATGQIVVPMKTGGAAVIGAPQEQ